MSVAAPRGFRGQIAIWDGVKPGPLAFDAVHRCLLVRLPDAGQKIAEALAAGKQVAKVELVLPYLDEEIWPQGSGPDYPCADGYLAAAKGRIYAAGWDGRLRSFDENGKSRWTCNLTPAMTPSDPIAALVASANYGDVPVWQAARSTTISSEVPRGENMLATGTAKLTVGGTRGWMSEGKVVQPTLVPANDAVLVCCQ